MADRSVLARHRSWLEAGSRLFFDRLEVIGDAELGAPSLLPGWTRAHVVTHLARNASALGNLLYWARTGIETPMYADRDARAADIEAGVLRPPADIREDARREARGLAEAMTRLPDPAWDAEVRTAAGRAVPAAEVAWMRVREVWVHAIDLNTGLTFSAVPGDVAEALLDDALGSIGKRPAAPALAVRCVESERSWRLGDGPAAELSAPRADVLAWALGRSDADVTSWPALPSWL